MKYPSWGRRASIMTLAALSLGMVSTANATIVYWTDFGGKTIKKTDTSTNTTTTVVNTPGSGNPDTLIFDTSGNIVYTMYNGNPGTVHSFNQNTSTDSVVSNAFGSQLVDIALDPGGASVLVSDRGNNQVTRVDLTTGTATVLATLTTPDGIAYDGSGNLFVAATSGGSQKIVQIDPVTGAIINAGDPNFSAGFLDGITYDPFSNLIYAANGGCMETFDPVTLLAQGCVGNFSNLDGVMTDGAGNILVADVGSNQVGSYNITAGTSSYLFSAPGLDDIAPVSGLGAPPPSVPEPETLLLFGTGIVGLMGLRRRNLAKA